MNSKSIFKKTQESSYGITLHLIENAVSQVAMDKVTGDYHGPGWVATWQDTYVVLTEFAYGL
jgi:hypothetical protein